MKNIESIVGFCMVVDFYTWFG